MQNRTFLVLLRPFFCEKLKLAPPMGKQPSSNVWISDFGRKISLNFVEDLFFFFFSFFGDHPILGGKNVWISDFGEDLFFFFFETTWFWAEKMFEFPRFPRNKLIQEQWKFGSRSFALFSRFQNSPPFPNPGYAPESILVERLMRLILINIMICGVVLG